MRGKLPIKYEHKSLQIFADLSQQALRRKMLKPLLAVMQNHEIRYNWGFPACLVGRRDRCLVKLRFPEEIQDFCKNMEIPIPEIPGWTVASKKGARG